MVEKRRPYFKRMGHAHPIDLVEHVVRQTYHLMPSCNSTQWVRAMTEHRPENFAIQFFQVTELMTPPGCLQKFPPEDSLLLGDKPLHFGKRGVFDIFC